ncbi:uncharacterized protein [Leishmania mexicana MHOM/GT/2001/U1103]|uniref:Uncharacterized protein n=1 Tax=Leishmania mexicana (strain MHOM/GT/2001/U1103) TaxID=929439 RepID=E9AJF7_LEIMU|nr:uncharacterized protein [Leishmania mexicana MHOM/GT/2001/U1103]CBZ23054.1 unnamed protein product [Leishmania mexicana MHOM/GT/2001/U1103]
MQDNTGDSNTPYVAVMKPVLDWSPNTVYVAPPPSPPPQHPCMACHYQLQQQQEQPYTLSAYIAAPLGLPALCPPPLPPSRAALVLLCACRQLRGGKQLSRQRQHRQSAAVSAAARCCTRVWRGAGVPAVEHRPLRPRHGHPLCHGLRHVYILYQQHALQLPVPPAARHVRSDYRCAPVLRCLLVHAAVARCHAAVVHHPAHIHHPPRVAEALWPRRQRPVREDGSPQCRRCSGDRGGGGGRGGCTS